MDARNDDSSAGSDSLDKSLQRKCVVDDMGQGEGKQQNEENLIESSCSDSFIKTHKKTEKDVGDGGGGGGVVVNADESSTCIEDKTATTNHISVKEMSDNDSSNISNHNNNNSNTFETKVTQISQDLKETTLAECNSASTSATALRRSSSDNAVASACSDSACAGATSLEQNSQLSDEASAADEHDSRSKKVRFHPDVKENDGGNRVIPKKKKKLIYNVNGSVAASSSASCSSGGASGSQRTPGIDDEMDYEDEEESVEEEEEFNLAKTIAEAQNYLKLHPLTFVRNSTEKNNPTSSIPLQNGLLQEEDLPLTSESSEEDEEITPENGIERILGKQITNGKAELLVRYEDKDGLHWENEEHITEICPQLMQKYEINRERRQERLMRHVAKRQNLRQRYTDF